MNRNRILKQTAMLAAATGVLLVSLHLAGCSDDEGVTGVGTTQSALAADPLDGVLASTLGYTPEGPSDRIQRLADLLGLSEDQEEALLSAYTEFRDGLEALHSQVTAGDLTWEEARGLAEALRDAFEAQLQVILTEEQYDLLQEMRAARHHPPRHERRLEDRWSAWLTQIGATEDQVTDVMAALRTLHAGMEGLHSRLVAGELTREEATDVARALRDEFDASLQSILTPEQYEQLLALRPDCDRGA